MPCFGYHSTGRVQATPLKPGRCLSALQFLEMAASLLSSPSLSNHRYRLFLYFFYAILLFFLLLFFFKKCFIGFGYLVHLNRVIKTHHSKRPYINLMVNDRGRILRREAFTRVGDFTSATSYCFPLGFPLKYVP